MSPEQNDQLLQLAVAVADGKPVDWNREKVTLKGLEGPLTGLQTLERISAVFQSTQGEIPPEALEPAPDQIYDQTTEPPAETPPPPTKWGHLTIKEKIGEGAFAEVFRAHDPFLKIDVALKLFRPDKTHNGWFADRFLREARKLAKVKHRHVVVVHGADRRDGRVGLWTDLIEGRTLEQILKRDGPMSPEVTATYGLKLCQALAAVHQAGLVHRDVKTSNVMVEKGGRIVLMDFNTSRERKPLEDFTSHDPGSGTPLFMPAELFEGKNSGTRIDIYSLGVLLYRLVTGRFPVQAQNLKDLIEKHERGEQTPLLDARSDLDPSFTHIVEKALSPDPQQRYSTVGELKNALAEFLGCDTDDRFTRFWPLPKWLTRTAAGLVLALGLAAGAHWYFFGPFQMEADLFKAGPLSETRLATGDRVAPGDQLFMKFEGSRRLHVYVANQDQRGNAYMLFPIPGTEIQNPLAADVLHHLPGQMDGVQQFWGMSSSGGRESFLVIASLRPLPDIEEELRKLTAAGEAPPEAPEIQPPRRRTRGFGTLEQRNSGEGHETAAPGPGFLERLADKADRKYGVQYWKAEFENPD